MNYSFKTISKKVMGDLHTPVSIYLKVRDIYPESALLESSDFHGNENSLSFIALRPLASIGINNGECTATFPDETREVTPLTEDYNVPEAMNAFLGRFKVEGADKKVCGLFGYTAFDAVRYFENIPVMEVHHEENDAPDMLYILYKYILVFNHFKNELTLVEMLQEDEASRLEEIETLIENRNFASYNFQTLYNCTPIAFSFLAKIEAKPFGTTLSAATAAPAFKKFRLVIIILFFKINVAKGSKIISTFAHI